MTSGRRGRDSGFTEEEKIALLFSQRQRSGRDGQSRKSLNNEDSTMRRPSWTSNCSRSELNALYNDDRRDRSVDEYGRNGDQASRRHHSMGTSGDKMKIGDRNRDRSSDRSRSGNRNGYKSRDMARMDRDRSRDRRRDTNRDRDRSRDRNRNMSRGRSRDRSRDMSRGRDKSRDKIRDRNRDGNIDDRNRDRSRSRSRGRRSPLPQMWRHDKFNDDRDEADGCSPQPEEGRRHRLPSDYRPPSPTWVSRAGGVAIIRGKIHS